MTVIAWDGSSMAADCAITHQGLTHKGNKLYKLSDGSLAGIAGDVNHCQEIINWLNTARSPEAYPKPTGDDEDCGIVMVVRPDKTIHLYDTSYISHVVEQSQYAIGSGSHVALTAMYLGKTAKQACALANKMIPNCGLGVKVIKHG